MKPLTDEQRKLAEENHKLIHAFIHQMKLAHDEYYGDMAEAYCIAVSAYDPQKGPLSTLVFRSMSNRLKTIRRRETSKKRIPKQLIISIDDDSCVSDVNRHSLSQSESVENVVILRMCIEILERECSPEEMQILRDEADGSLSRREAARRRNVPHTTYCRRVKAAKEKALRILNEAPTK